MVNNRPTPNRVEHDETDTPTVTTTIGNGDVLIAAGIVAKKAVERGMKVPPYVKTSLAPGSRVVTEYLEKTGM